MSVVMVYLLCHCGDLVCPNSLSSINNNSSASVFIIKMKTGISMSDFIFCAKQHYITTASQRVILQNRLSIFPFQSWSKCSFYIFGGISGEQHHCEVTCLFVHLLNFPWAAHTHIICIQESDLTDITSVTDGFVV